MKTLIVYYSLTNNNELLAMEIAKQWQGDYELFKIQELKSRSGFRTVMDNLFNLIPKINLSHLPQGSFDNYVFICPIWMGKLASPLRAFLVSQKQVIKKYSFITLCGGIDGQRRKIIDQLNTLLGHGAEVVSELRIDSHYKEWPKHPAAKHGASITSDEFQSFSKEISLFVEDCNFIPVHLQ